MTTLAFEKKTAGWHIQVYKAEDGTAIIQRLVGRKGTKPASWPSPRTPENWVSIQRKPQEYTPV